MHPTSLPVAQHRALVNSVLLGARWRASRQARASKYFSRFNLARVVLLGENWND